MRSERELRDNIERSIHFLDTTYQGRAEKYLKINQLNSIVRRSNQSGQYVLVHRINDKLHLATRLRITTSDTTYQITMTDRSRGDLNFTSIQDLFSYINKPTQAVDEGLEDSGRATSYAEFSKPEAATVSPSPEDIKNATDLLDSPAMAIDALQEIGCTEETIAKFSHSSQQISIQPLAENLFEVSIEKHRAFFTPKDQAKTTSPKAPTKTTNPIVFSAKQIMRLSQCFKIKNEKSYERQMQASYLKAYQGLHELAQLADTLPPHLHHKLKGQIDTLTRSLAQLAPPKRTSAAAGGGYSPRLSAPHPRKNHTDAAPATNNTTCRK